MSEKAREFYKNFLFAANKIGIYNKKEHDSLETVNFPNGFLEQFERIGCHDFLKNIDKLEDINIKFKKENELIENNLKEYFIKNRLKKILYYENDIYGYSYKKYLDQNLNISTDYNNINLFQNKINPSIVDILFDLVYWSYDQFQESRYNILYKKNFKNKNQSFEIFYYFFDNDEYADLFNNLNLNYRKKQRIRALEAISNSLLPDKDKLMSLMNDAIDFYKNIYELHDSDYIKFMIKHCDVINNPDNKDIIYIISEYIELFDVKLTSRQFYNLPTENKKIFYKLLLLINENSNLIQDAYSIKTNLYLLLSLSERYLKIKIYQHNSLYVNFNIEGIIFDKIEYNYSNQAFPDLYLYNTKENIKLNFNHLSIYHHIILLSHV